MSRTTAAATATAALIMSSTSVSAFTVAPQGKMATSANKMVTSTQLHGLFDGVKDAFSAPALEKSTIDAERETPIDRWMGWTVKSENQNTPNESECRRLVYYIIVN